MKQSDLFAIQQFLGMHYSEGKNVEAVVVGMGLEKHEWERIKPECEFLSKQEIEEIECVINPRQQ